MLLLLRPFGEPRKLSPCIPGAGCVHSIGRLFSKLVQRVKEEPNLVVFLGISRILLKICLLLTEVFLL